jgi:hypothetical protein
MFPGRAVRRRVNDEFRPVKTQIVAVVRAQHQPVAQKSDRIAVRIFCLVDDFNARHSAGSA